MSSRILRLAMVAAGLACAGVFACQSVLGIEDTQDDPPGLDGGSSGDFVDAPTTPLTDAPPPPLNEAGDQPDLTDAEVVVIGTDAGATDGAPPPATACLPTASFLSTVTPAGTVCNKDNLLPGHTLPTGLDYTTGPPPVPTIDGRSVTACVGATFAKPLKTVTVRASSTEKACDHACTAATCKTGDIAHVFIVTLGVNKYLSTLTLAATPADFTVPIPADRPGSQVLVCRTGNGPGRDDVNVHAVFGNCD